MLCNYSLHGRKIIGTLTAAANTGGNDEDGTFMLCLLGLQQAGQWMAPPWPRVFHALRVPGLCFFGVEHKLGSDCVVARHQIIKTV